MYSFVAFCECFASTIHKLWLPNMHFYHDLLASLISCKQKLVYSCISFLYFLKKKPHDNGILLKRALIADWLSRLFSSLINLDFSSCTLHTLTQALFLIFKDFEFRFYHVVSFLHFDQYDIWSHRCIISIDSVGQFYTFVLSFRLCLSLCLNIQRYQSLFHVLWICLFQFH